MRKIAFIPHLALDVSRRAMREVFIGNERHTAVNGKYIDWLMSEIAKAKREGNVTRQRELELQLRSM